MRRQRASGIVFTVLLLLCQRFLVMFSNVSFIMNRNANVFLIDTDASLHSIAAVPIYLSRMYLWTHMTSASLGLHSSLASEWALLFQTFYCLACRSLLNLSSKCLSPTPCSQEDQGWHRTDVGLQLWSGQCGRQGAALLLWLFWVHREVTLRPSFLRKQNLQALSINLTEWSVLSLEPRCPIQDLRQHPNPDR